MTKRLIVNADGFGFTFGNNRGIVECLEAGTVRSVSVNANFAAAEALPELRRFPHASVGIHFNLSVGPCVADPRAIPHLVNEKGELLGRVFPSRLLRGGIPRRELIAELTAQAERMSQLWSPITHWDSHQNLHLLPSFFSAAMEVANAHGITRMRTHDHHLHSPDGNRIVRACRHLSTHPGRGIRYLWARRLMTRARRRGMRMADRLISPAPLGDHRKYERDFWLHLFRCLPEGTSEIYCHPAYPDEELRAWAVYVEERRRELEILRDPMLVDEAQRQGVELISFHEV